MGFLTLIADVGNSFLVGLYLTDQITLQELSREIGSSSAELVDDYKKSRRNI